MLDYSDLSSDQKSTVATVDAVQRLVFNHNQHPTIHLRGRQYQITSGTRRYQVWGKFTGHGWDPRDNAAEALLPDTTHVIYVDYTSGAPLFTIETRKGDPA